MTERILRNGWNCLRIADDGMELAVALDFGPRVVHCSLPGQENLFYDEGLTPGDADPSRWYHYGGHRLWHGPQVGDRPNEPDNAPPECEFLPDGVILRTPPEPKSHIAKEMEIRLVNGEATITHRLTNHGVWPVRLTAWAITQMAPGGTAILPLPGVDSCYLPTYAVACWPFTRLNDPRMRFEDNHIQVRQDPANAALFKIGYANLDGWMTYDLRGQRFVKRFVHDGNAEYSDYGSSCECYADERFLEVESLSQLVELETGKSVEHREWWRVESLEE